MADEFKIVASLDIPKSVQEINKDIPKLQGQSKHLKIIADLDPKLSIKNIQATLNKMNNNANIKIGIDTSGLNSVQGATQSIANSLKNVQTQAQQTASAVNNVKSELMKLDTTSVENTSFKAAFVNKADNIIDLEKTLANARQELSKFGKVDFSWLKDIGGNVSEITAKITDATGVVERFRYAFNVDAGNFSWIGSSGNNSGVEKLSIQIEETRVKYNRLLADFKSSNSAIQSGLTQPIEHFEDVLNNLGKTSSINDVKNAFESLKQSASEIRQYLDTTNSSFDKATNAVNNYKNMDNILKDMTASFDTLIVKPENMGKELDDVKAKLKSLQEIEKSEGFTENWAKQYREVNLEITRIRNNIKLAEQASKTNASEETKIQLQYLGELNKAYQQLISNKNKLASATNEDTKNAYADEVKKSELLINNLTEEFNATGLVTKEIQSQIDVLKEKVALTDRINTNKANDKIQSDNLKAQEQAIRNYISLYDECETKISNTITKLNSLNNSTTFSKNASNPQVIKIKQDIVDILSEYQKLSSALETTHTSEGLNKINEDLIKLNARFNDTTATAQRFEQNLKDDNGAEKLAQRVALLKAQLTALAKANPKALKQFGNEINSLMATLNNSPDGRAVEQVAKSIQVLRKEINNADLAGKTFFQRLKDNVSKFSGWMSMTYAISLFTRSVREAVVELKDIDTILTEISKTSDRTTESLKKLGETSFATASKYGQKASDYLLGVQEMSRAGFGEKESEQMAELSTLAQSAGDMTAELANEYLIATNAGYQFGGSAEKLNAVLNSQNYITNRNALNMSELAEATKIVASQAAQSGIGIDEMTAAVGTMIATTQQGGEVAARALKGILMNLQAVKGTAEDIGDGGEDITDESLTKYEKACLDLGVALKEVKNGVLQLRDPMVILEELANAVSKEAEGSIKVANLVSAIGGKYRGGQLLSLLRNWETYSKMLSEFNSNEAVGSAFDEAMKSAESWEGKLNELSNTWTDFVNGLVTSDTVKGVIDFLTTIIKNIDKLRDSIGTIPTLLGSIATVGAFKNVGELLNTPVYAQPQLICA